MNFLAPGWVPRELSEPLFDSGRISRGRRLNIDTNEVAYFASAGFAEISSFFMARLGIGFHEESIQDYYFDTPNRKFLEQSSSLRIRRYAQSGTACSFDVIWVRWPAPRRRPRGNPFTARRQDITVQSFWAKSESNFEAILNEYRRRGYQQVLSFSKTRRTFEVRPTQLCESSRGALSVVPGLRVCLDLPRPGSFINKPIVEVEFGRRYRKDAAALVQDFLRKYDRQSTPKFLNKIVLALAPTAQATTSIALSIRSRVSKRPETLGMTQKSTYHWFVRAPALPSKQHSPGVDFFVKEGWHRSATPRHKRLRVTVPARLHFCVWDFAKLKRGAAGGGGLGISCSAYETVVEIQHRSRRSASQQVPATARHFAKLFTDLVGYDVGRLSISVVSRIPYAHRGLGSNVSLNVAVLWGLNKLFGQPFTSDEIAEILMRNYVESDDDKLVFRGLDTGVGETCLLRGGLAWMDADGGTTGIREGGPLYAIVACGRPEALEISASPLILDAEYRRLYSRSLLPFLSRKLKPAFLAGDMPRFWKLGWDLNRKWSLKIARRFYRADVLTAFTKIVKDGGGLYAGLSSEGPSMFAVVRSRDEAPVIARQLARRLSSYFVEFKIGRLGKALSTEFLA